MVSAHSTDIQARQNFRGLVNKQKHIKHLCEEKKNQKHFRFYVAKKD
jgi:hypothetical protein